MKSRKRKTGNTKPEPLPSFLFPLSVPGFPVRCFVPEHFPAALFPGDSLHKWKVSLTQNHPPTPSRMNVPPWCRDAFFSPGQVFPSPAYPRERVRVGVPGQRVLSRSMRLLESLVGPLTFIFSPRICGERRVQAVCSRSRVVSDNIRTPCKGRLQEAGLCSTRPVSGAVLQRSSETRY
jgi:hypothetical protein